MFDVSEEFRAHFSVINYKENKLKLIKVSNFKLIYLNYLTWFFNNLKIKYSETKWQPSSFSFINTKTKNGEKKEIA